jgi:hypothetical protein
VRRVLEHLQLDVVHTGTDEKLAQESGLGWQNVFVFPPRDQVKQQYVQPVS